MYVGDIAADLCVCARVRVRTYSQTLKPSPDSHPHARVLQYAAEYCSVCCSVLQRVHTDLDTFFQNRVHMRVLQCAAICCSVRCSVL